MLKLLIAGRRAPGKSREAAQRHLRQVHGPLVYDPPPDCGPMPAAYVQNHVFDGSEIPALAGRLAERDLVTEIWFDDPEHVRAAIGTSYYLNVLQPDEQNFVDQANVLKAVMREGAMRGARPPEAAKVFAFLKRTEAADAADFAAACAEAFDQAQRQAAGALLNTALPAPDGGEPYADHIAQFWFPTRAEAVGFCEARLPALFAALTDRLSPAASSYLLAEEYDVARLRAARRYHSDGA